MPRYTPGLFIMVSVLYRQYSESVRTLHNLFMHVFIFYFFSESTVNGTLETCHMHDVVLCEVLQYP